MITKIYYKNIKDPQRVSSNDNKSQSGYKPSNGLHSVPWKTDN